MPKNNKPSCLNDYRPVALCYVLDVKKGWNRNSLSETTDTECGADQGCYLERVVLFQKVFTGRVEEKYK